MKCEYCGDNFYPRNRWGQPHQTCGKKSCQRLRKTVKQRERREQVRGAIMSQRVEAIRDPKLRRVLKQYGATLPQLLRQLRSVGVNEVRQSAAAHGLKKVRQLDHT